MKFKTGLLIFLGLSALLLTAACVGRQLPDERVTSAPKEAAGPDQAGHAESNTQDYVHGWTKPTGDDSGKPLTPAENKAGRKRMLSNDSDSYQRAWTFPTDESSKSKKSSGETDSRSDSPKISPPDDTEEYLNGWTFE